MGHVRIAWQCKECGWLTVSDSKLRHQMDYCRCEKTALDLEETYARMMGAYKPLLILKEGSTEWKPIRPRPKKKMEVKAVAKTKRYGATDEEIAEFKKKHE